MNIENLQYKEIINDVSFSIPKGQILCILGENGSGKSTLLKILSGYYRNFSGNISIENKDLLFFSEEDLYKTRSVLTQHNFISNPILCQDYIELATYNSKMRSKAELNETLLEIADTLHITHLLQKDYTECSGGEQQRISLAKTFMQALINHTEPAMHYIFLDEPFNSIDIKHMSHVIQQINQSKSLNFGIVVVLHDINLAYSICDQVLFLKKGQIVDFGKKELIFNTNNLNLTFDISFEETLLHDGKKYFSPQETYPK